MEEKRLSAHFSTEGSKMIKHVEVMKNSVSMGYFKRSKNKEVYVYELTSEKCNKSFFLITIPLGVLDFVSTFAIVLYTECRSFTFLLTISKQQWHVRLDLSLELLRKNSFPLLD